MNTGKNIKKDLLFMGLRERLHIITVVLILFIKMWYKIDILVISRASILHQLTKPEVINVRLKTRILELTEMKLFSKIRLSMKQCFGSAVAELFLSDFLLSMVTDIGCLGFREMAGQEGSIK